MNYDNLHREKMEDLMTAQFPPPIVVDLTLHSVLAPALISSDPPMLDSSDSTAAQVTSDCPPPQHLTLFTQHRSSSSSTSQPPSEGDFIGLDQDDEDLYERCF